MEALPGRLERKFVWKREGREKREREGKLL
jgi:hypothetical protein